MAVAHKFLCHNSIFLFLFFLSVGNKYIFVSYQDIIFQYFIPQLIKKISRRMQGRTHYLKHLTFQIINHSQIILIMHVKKQHQCEIITLHKR